MSKIHKIEMYVIDHSELYSCYDSISDILENVTDLSCKVINEKSTLFDWDDDLPVNKVNCPLEEYEKYFADEDISEQQCIASKQEYIERSTWVVWELVEDYGDTCVLENKDETFFLTKYELEEDFVKIN